MNIRGTRSWLGLRPLAAVTMAAGCCLALQAAPVAEASVGGHVLTRIITFRYASIQVNARRSLERASQAAQGGNGAAAAVRLPAGRFLRLTARAFESEKQGVLSQHAGVSLVHDYALLPVAIVRVSGAAALASLAADPRVASVTPERTYATASARAANLTRGPRGQSFAASSAPADLSLIDDAAALKNGDRGEGTVVAVLDDGTNYKNSAFGNCKKVGDAKCSVLDYKDFDTPPAKGLSFTGHGTNVAGQVLKDAPSAKLVIGNVFTKTGATDADIMNGLEWVLSEEAKFATTYSFRAVNLSLGVPFDYNTTACTSSSYTGVFSQLLAVNIQPVVAAGNTAYDGTTFTNGIGSPACTPGALAVGAVYDKNIGSFPVDQTINGRKSDCTDKKTAADKIACFSQGGPLVGVLAPGIREKAAGISDSGTSQATPLVSGAIAALASGALGAGIGQITSAVESTGKSITDARTGDTTPRLDVTAAEKSLNSSSVGGAIIKSGNVGMGIFQWGDLNVNDQVPSAQGTSAYGLRYLPTNNDFTGPGCLCEGWGVADTGSGADGYADEAEGDAGLTLASFTHSATTATSVATIGKTFKITNAYSPVSKVPDLFQDKVTIKNTSGTKLSDVVYRRLVDWDMEPTAFNEYVTVQGLGNSKVLLGTTNDGFDSADPLSASDNLGATGNFVRFGPLDQGAQFNFGFGALKTGGTISFTEYYGAAKSEAQAYKDLAKVKVQAYSVGEPSSSSDGTPNSAMLGFSGIGGKPLKFPPQG